MQNVPSASGTTLWQTGWYQYAKPSPSPNFGPRPTGTQINLIVIHSISLPPSQFGGGFIEQLFHNALDHACHPYFKTLEGVKVSAHFLIKRGGELVQFVSCDDRAWHAGTSSHMGRENCNDYSVGIELEGEEFDGPFETAQYETLTSLCAALICAYPVKHFAGHEHIARGRKKDPGKRFKWSYLQKSLGLGPAHFP